jgi:hypothetical protein
MVKEKLRKVQNNDLRLIIERMLSIEPEKRPFAEELVKLLYGIRAKSD